MKSTGIVRQMDHLGRVVLPIELRRTLDIHEKDALEIYVDEDSIILKKYEPACIFCGRRHPGLQGQECLLPLHGRNEVAGACLSYQSVCIHLPI